MDGVDSLSESEEVSCLAGDGDALVASVAAAEEAVADDREATCRRPMLDEASLGSWGLPDGSPEPGAGKECALNDPEPAASGGAEAGDRRGGGDLRPGDFSLGSRSFGADGVEVVLTVRAGGLEDDVKADLGRGENTCLAKLGRGRDMGSLELLRCDNLTGPSEFRFSGFSSKSGVPGRLPAPSLSLSSSLESPRWGLF